MQTLYACPNVRTTSRRRAAQPAADEGVPRARASSRAPSGSSACSTSSPRSSSSTRSSSAAATTPTSSRRRTRVLRQEPARVLPARRAALGAPARGAGALDRDGQARRRDGLADLVRRRRPAELRLDPGRLERRMRPSSPRARTSAPARGRRSPRSPPRSSGCRSTQVDDLARRHRRAARTPRSRPAPRRCPSMGPAVRAAAADARRQILELAAQRYDLEAERALARRRLDRPPRRRAQRRSTEIVGLLGNGADPRHGRARAEPGRDDACSPSASRSSRSRSTSRPAR